MALAKTYGKPGRLHGLDFARFLAFAGMVFVNFHVVTGLGEGAFWAETFLTALEGKAAATFVVLAGLGLGLGAQRDETNRFAIVTLKRALFLFVIGLLNTLIFSADILHYYAIYFVFGLMLIRSSTRVIVTVALILPVAFVVLLGVIDYETGWNWEAFEYVGFWTPDGFVRNLFYNGWHPVVPWLSFLLLGIVFSRLNLRDKRIQIQLIAGGAGALVIAYGGSVILSGLDAELAELVSVSPVPPLPLYMLAGSGSAALVIGLCLVLFANGEKAILQPLVSTGKQALSLYIMHIFIGMGVLEALGMLGGQSAELAILAASLFIILAVVYAMTWARFFKAGPLEWLMRRVTG